MTDYGKSMTGKRVMVFASVNDKTKVANFIGRGVFAGMFIPEDAVGYMASAMRENKEVNPRLDLDNGEHVWGCECWWIVEQQGDMWLMELQSRNYKIQNVSVEELRKQFKTLKGDKGVTK